MCPYQVLEVSPDATDEEIKAAYRNLARKHHPDRQGGDGVVFREIGEAYRVLSDPDQRAYYDRTGKLPGVRQSTTKVERFIAGMLLEAFTQDTEDPMRLICRNLRDKRENALGAALEGRKLRLELVDKIERFRKQNADAQNTVARDFILAAMDGRLGDVDHAILAADSDAAFFAEAVTYIDGLKCVSDVVSGDVMFPYKRSFEWK